MAMQMGKKLTANKRPFWFWFLQIKSIFLHLNRIDLNPTISDFERSKTLIDSQACIDPYTQIELTQLQFSHLPILLHAKGHFLINNGTFLKVHMELFNSLFSNHFNLFLIISSACRCYYYVLVYVYPVLWNAITFRPKAFIITLIIGS